MSQIASGPLPALVRYYERLEAEPHKSIPEFGFSREKIHFEIVLNKDGSRSDFRDIRLTNDRGKSIPNPMTVPDAGGRQGTGLKPFFCWDNTGYALGRDNKGNSNRAKEMFTAFRELHLSMRDAIGKDDGFASLCKFLEKWNPKDAPDLPNWEEAAGLNVVFRLRGNEGYVHQSAAIKRAWRKRVNQDLAETANTRGTSLITGEAEDLARLHPLISGVSGTNTTGAAIVSFNLDAFTSYGRTQSYNAPVGVQDAFRYTTALNRLLSDDGRRVRIGDATVVFWTDRAEAKGDEDLLSAIFGEEMQSNETAEASKASERVLSFLQAAKQGRIVDELKDPEAPFYILGLSPNASRINIRFWLASTVGQFAQRLAEHVNRVEIVRPISAEGDPPAFIRRLLWETAREPKDIPPQLAGEMTRAILGGLAYPQLLFSSVVRRIRVDTDMNYRRAGILKAYLIRNKGKEVPMALNKDHPEQAYQLGRLFAALEKTQEDSTEGGKLNVTVKDRYFGAASATPASVFPRLLRLHQHHLNKLTNTGQRINREKLIGEICGHISRFPSHMPLDQQGLFYVAYYHQRQDFFTRREDDSKEKIDE